MMSPHAMYKRSVEGPFSSIFSFFSLYSPPSIRSCIRCEANIKPLSLSSSRLCPKSSSYVLILPASIYYLHWTHLAHRCCCRPLFSLYISIFVCYPKPQRCLLLRHTTSLPLLPFLFPCRASRHIAIQLSSQ